MTVAIAVLAAGRGSRLGGETAKPLLEWRGRPLVAWAVEAARASGLRPLVIVVGYQGDAVRAVLPNDGALVVVGNPHWEEGIASSLQAALTALEPLTEVDAVCVGLADQPLVTAETYQRVAASDGEIVVPYYDGQPGNPVKLARSLWHEAMKLRGDIGARALMHDRVVSRLDCTGTGSAADVDTLDDLLRLPQEGP